MRWIHQFSLTSRMVKSLIGVGIIGVGIIGVGIFAAHTLLMGRAEAQSEKSKDQHNMDVSINLPIQQKQLLASSPDAALCGSAVLEAEQQGNIPRKLLLAIATAESGLPIGVSDSFVPWPWTVRSGGVGYYYQTKKEAVQAIEALFRHGVRNIDVGCMQINLLYHSDAFASVDEAIDPVNNVAYGTSFLNALRSRHKVWSQTIGFYHSSDVERQSVYRERVFEIWKDINRYSRQQLVQSNREKVLERRAQQKNIDAENQKRRQQTALIRAQQQLRDDSLQDNQEPVNSGYQSQLRQELDARSRALTPVATVRDALGNGNQIADGLSDIFSPQPIIDDTPPSKEKINALEGWLLRKLDQQNGDTSFDVDSGL